MLKCLTFFEVQLKVLLISVDIWSIINQINLLDKMGTFAETVVKPLIAYFDHFWVEKSLSLSLSD